MKFQNPILKFVWTEGKQAQLNMPLHAPLFQSWGHKNWRLGDYTISSYSVAQ